MSRSDGEVGGTMGAMEPRRLDNRLRGDPLDVIYVGPGLLVCCGKVIVMRAFGRRQKSKAKALRRNGKSMLYSQQINNKSSRETPGIAELYKIAPPFPNTFTRLIYLGAAAVQRHVGRGQQLGAAIKQ